MPQIADIDKKARLENPVQGGTLFRNMPAGDSGASRQVFVI
jgi:hypothetical protein